MAISNIEIETILSTDLRDSSLAAAPVITADRSLAPEVQMATELTSEEIYEVLKQNAEVVERVGAGDPHALASLFAAAGVTVTATKVTEVATEAG